MDEFTLTPAEYAATRQKLDKVNARAVKRGYTGRFELTATPTIVSERTESGLTVDRPAFACTITGEAPCYAGWRFLAAVDALPGADGEPNWVVRTAPGVEDSGVDRSSLIYGHCGHCGTYRANRRKLMLVQSATTGEVKQVGSTCLKDFLGWDGRPVWIDLRRVAEDLEPVTRAAAAEYTPRSVVAAAIAAVAEYGWTPASGEGIPTSERVRDLLAGLSTERTVGIAEHVPAAEAAVDTDLADAVRLTAAGTGDYAQNLHAALTAVAVGPRTLALVCSTVGFLARERTRQIEADRAVDAPNEHLGEVGEKITITGDVTVCLARDGYHPGSREVFAVIRTDRGDVKLSTAAGWAFDDAFDRGAHVTVTGTVKQLGEYNGRKQTTLVRPKLAA